MTDCPSLDDFTATDDTTRAHIAGCVTCRIVAELNQERHKAQTDRERRAKCARFELLIAARSDGSIGGPAGLLLDEHLRHCAECRGVAETIAPPDLDSPGELPSVDTAAYALGREVARGGMGRILAARDLRIGRAVAVKELLAGSAMLAARFEREARVTARLQHPGIVPIYEIGRWPDGTPFYTMRMVEGQTLRAVMESKTTFAERLALLPSVIAAADAVAFAHARRVIHRDLTPNNILVGDHGETVVIDWGLAKDLARGDDDEPTAGPYRDDGRAGDLTMAGAVIGTAAFMPPEQARGEAVDTRADVYALGAILYHLLAGAPPYRASRSEDVLRLVQLEAPAAIEEVAPGAPRDLTSIVRKAMARNQKDRYATAAELVEDLRRFQTGRIVEAHRYSRSEQLRRWVRAHRGIVVACVATILALGVSGTIGVAGVIRERDRSELQRVIAVGERAAAEAAKSKAQRENAALMQEQGRQELLAGNTTRALVWLGEAYRAGDTSPELRFLLGTAMRQIEAVERTLECAGRGRIDELSPDQATLLAACGGSVKIWRVDDGTLVRSIGTEVHAAHFSQDGKWIASHDYAGAVVWDAATGEPAFSLRPHGGRQVRSAFFTPDGRFLVTTGDDATARVWDARTGSARHVLAAGTAKMNVVRGFTIDGGRQLLTAISDGSVAIWDVSTGARRASFRMPSQFFGSGKASEDGKRFVTCGTDGVVRIAELPSGRVTLSLSAHAVLSFDCSFSPDGRRVLSTGFDGTARIWNTDGALVASLVHDGRLAHAKFSPDGRSVVTLGGEGLLKLWDVASGSPIASFDDPSGFADRVAFSRDGRRMFAVREPFSIVVLKDLDAGQRAVGVPEGTQVVKASRSTSQVLLRGAGEAVTLADVTTLKVLPHERLLEPVTWSADGARVAGFTGDHAIVLDARTGTTIARLAVQQKPERLELDAAGASALVVDGRARIWTVASGATLPLGSATHAGGLSPDGAMVAAWTDLKHVEVWDLSRRAIRRTLVLPEDIMEVLGYDGQTIVLTERDARTGMDALPFLSKIVFHDLATGARITEVRGRVFAWLEPASRLVSSSGINRIIELRRAADGKLVSAFSPGTSMFVLAAASSDGNLVLTNAGSKVAVRSANDGRTLGELNSLVNSIQISQDTYQFSWQDLEASADTTWLLTLGKHPTRWLLPSEQRSPAEIDRIIRERVRWELRDGRLVPVTATLRGRVVRNGKPAPGATIGIAMPLWITVEADASGSFTIPDVRDGNYLLIAQSPDKVAAAHREIEVRGDLSLDVVLDADASIEGRVVDQDGRPVPHARVMGVCCDRSYHTDTTDAEGRFKATGIVRTVVQLRVAGEPAKLANVPAEGLTIDLARTPHVTGVELVVRRATPGP